jgi:hypothetical protein
MLASAAQPGRYSEILKKTVSAAFVGVIMLTVIIGTIEYAGLTIRFGSVMKKGEKIYQNDFPHFEYTADKGLSIDAKMPVEFEDDAVLYVIDTTDPTDKIFAETYAPKFASYRRAVFIGNREVVMKNSELETRTIDLRQLDSLAPFTKEDIAKKFYYWKYFALIIFPFYLVYYFCAKLIGVLIVSLIALVINSSSKYGFSYASLFTASAFALTMPVLVDTVFSIAGIHIPMFFLIYFAIAAIYLIIGLKKAHESISAETPKAE